MEEKVYPALADIPELLPLIELMNANGYDYQRYEEVMMLGSADLSYSISYVM